MTNTKTIYRIEINLEDQWYQFADYKTEEASIRKSYQHYKSQNPNNEFRLLKITQIEITDIEVLIHN